MDISVVIPIYGCRAALEELHRRLTDTLVAMDKEYEIILVNDSHNVSLLLFLVKPVKSR